MSDEIIRHGTSIPEPEATSREPEQSYEFLAFVLANEHYGLPLSAVREIVKPPPITEVPRAPRDVLGVISVRGRVTTVIDLRRRLRMVEAAQDKWTRILLIDTGEEILGLLVDRVLQVYRLGGDEMELATSLGGDTTDYVMGIGRPRSVRGVGRVTEEGQGGRDEDDIVILLDPVALLKR